MKTKMHRLNTDNYFEIYFQVEVGFYLAWLGPLVLFGFAVFVSHEKLHRQNSCKLFRGIIMNGRIFSLHI